jgi:hypothetical protein
MDLGRRLSYKNLSMSAWVVRIADQGPPDRRGDKLRTTGQEVLEASVEPQAVFPGLASRVGDRVELNTSHGVLVEGEERLVDGKCPDAS